VTKCNGTEGKRNRRKSEENWNNGTEWSRNRIELKRSEHKETEWKRNRRAERNGTELN
jgi:hypothetical protein